MGRTLYLDCSSGISGDMTVAALLDLGANQGKLERALASLPVDGFSIVIGRVTKNGLAACDFDVCLDAAHENHDHDMAWLHGHEEHHHNADHAHTHEHDHGPGAKAPHVHDHGHHEHRHLGDVLAILEQADLTNSARALAVRVFEILAAAEAQAHGTTPEQVHFHEVGAIDSIVDVVAAAVLVDDLAVDTVIIPELTEGCGTIRCAHGVMPIPVPAVCAIVQTHKLPLRPSGVRGELVTPTGAALAAALRTSGQLPERYTIHSVGLGAGKRTYEGCSGVLRAMLIEADSQRSDTIVCLECDIDDCTGEALGQVIDTLLSAGAREAHYLPLVTKKGRPGWQLQVICTEAERPALETLIFEETTTIGIRRSTMERTILPRRRCTVETPYGSLAAKAVTLPSGRERIYPEHSSVAEAAKQFGTSYQEVYRACLAGCLNAQG